MVRTITRETAEASELAALWIESHQLLIPKIRAILLKHFRAEGRQLPWRNNPDPYEVLIAEILLQKTSYVPVEKVWKALIRKYPDFLSLAAADTKDVAEIIGVLGIRKRADRLVSMAKIVVDGDGKIPADELFLKSLPGVGQYTASAVLSFSFGVQVPVVDVNTARVYSRICGILAQTARQGLAFAEVIGDKVITRKNHKEINYGILDFSSAVCQVKPKCSICRARGLCQSLEPSNYS